MTEPATVRMPVFPLGTVLLPGQMIPLQVFEPRYRVLLFDLRDEEPAEFVVTLIERGSEIGGGDVRSGVGCVATITSIEELPDGRALIAAVGTRPVVVKEWLEEDPYPQATVSALRDTAWPHSDSAAQALVERVTGQARSIAALAARLGAPTHPEPLELASDPVRRCWQVALLTPLATIDRQRLLAETDPLERWRLLDGLLAEQQEVLEARLDWGNPPEGPQGLR